MIVLLDNGHGHNTPGKRSPQGLCTSKGRTAFYEFEFNRDIVERIANLIHSYNIERINQEFDEILNFRILVPEETDIKLGERCHRANAITRSHDGLTILISVHANAGGGSGFEFFTSVGQTQSDKVAEVFYDVAREMFPQFAMRTDGADGDQDKEAHFYILKNTICPAVLTENLFYDHKKDLEYLLTDEGRQQIAVMHFEVIRKIFENQDLIK